jgi:hypothetical protein
MTPMQIQIKEQAMKLQQLTVVSATALLLGMAPAFAQSGSSTTTPGAATNQNKCWDQATHQVRDKMASSSNPSGSSTSGTTGSSSNMGASGSTGSMGSTGSSASGSTGSSTGAGSSASTRPPEAAGLPNC